jgi:hypothetical protein
MTKREYIEGKEATERFEKAMKGLFRRVARTGFRFLVSA